MRLLLLSITFTVTLLCRLSALDLLSSLASSPHIHRSETAIKKALTPISDIEPNSGMNGVDCMYVVNLEKRPEKWQRIQSICNAYGLLPSRMNAVDGSQLSNKTIKTLCGRYPVRLRPGQIGCLLSHVSIFLDSYQRKFNCIWICEDDIDFLDNPLQMPELLNQLTKIDPNWDILYTDPEFVIPACYGPNWPPTGTPLPNMGYDFRPDQYHLSLNYYFSKWPIDKHFTAIGQRYGTYSYFVSQKGIQKLMNYFLHVYLWSPVDVDMHYVPGIRQYVLNKPVISHWLESDTTDTIK